MEEYLPHPLTGDRDRPQIGINYRADMDRAMSRQDYEALTPNLSFVAIDQFHDRMLSYGLTDLETEILVQLYCYNQTLAEAAKKHDVSPEYIWQIEKRAKNKLIKAGYRLNE